MPHQVRVDATPVRHELIAIVAIPYEKLGYQTLGFIERWVQEFLDPANFKIASFRKIAIEEN